MDMYRIIKKKLDEDPAPPLESSNDWPEWKDYVKGLMDLFNVWEYCDPSVRSCDIPELKEPIKPEITSVKLSAKSIVDLEPEHFAELVSLTSKYKAEKEIFDQKMLALDQLALLVFCLVPLKLQALLDYHSIQSLRTSETAWKELTTLSDIMEPVSQRTLDRLQDEWRTGFDTANDEDCGTELFANSENCDRRFLFCCNFLEKCQYMKLVKQDIDPEIIFFEMGCLSWMSLSHQSWFKMPGFSDPMPNAAPSEVSEGGSVYDSENSNEDGEASEGIEIYEGCPQKSPGREVV
ncbi:uncharacterized protein N7498_005109 [Penicillium cinerascens]|uniref:Uncharacterized protein n=1 Tax=Penicillium cinerascens TaxID=70096 RepID=A0A9W9T088_9EURO|nr:uncharacterized protein N7498_005109 [Penicillium cinerascens]KAJ5204230.1 hypothetical protein N7498_005109 [Penicillium cinerascens]